MAENGNYIHYQLDHRRLLNISFEGEPLWNVGNDTLSTVMTTLQRFRGYTPRDNRELMDVFTHLRGFIGAFEHNAASVLQVVSSPRRGDEPLHLRFQMPFEYLGREGVRELWAGMSGVNSLDGGSINQLTMSTPLTSFTIAHQPEKALVLSELVHRGVPLIETPVNSNGISPQRPTIYLYTGDRTELEDKWFAAFNSWLNLIE